MGRLQGVVNFLHCLAHICRPGKELSNSMPVRTSDHNTRLIKFKLTKFTYKEWCSGRSTVQASLDGPISCTPHTSWSLSSRSHNHHRLPQYKGREVCLDFQNSQTLLYKAEKK